MIFRAVGKLKVLKKRRFLCAARAVLTTTATLLNKKLQLNRFQWLLMLQVLLLFTTTSGKSKCILKVVCDRRFSCKFRIASASQQRKIVIIWRNFRLCVKVGQKEADCRFCSSFFHIFVFSLLCRKLWPHIDPKEAKKLVIVSNCVKVEGAKSVIRLVSFFCSNLLYASLYSRC